jgi:hypothetical protein
VEVKDQFPPHMMKMNEFPYRATVKYTFPWHESEAENQISLKTADITTIVIRYKVTRICSRDGNSDRVYTLLAELTYGTQRLTTDLPNGSTE